MYFVRLSGGQSTYSVGWRIEDEPDQWTERFLRFKASYEADTKGGALVLREAVREVMKLNQLRSNRTGLTTALSSVKTKCDSRSPLFVSGTLIAREESLQWLPDLFTKQPHRPLRSIPQAAQRDAEVRDKYECKIVKGLDGLIILDDFVTRGATLGEMSRAFARANPRAPRPLGLALGKNERKGFAGQFGVTVDNRHIPADWDALWTGKQCR